MKTGFEENKISIPGFHRSPRFRYALAYQDTRSFLNDLLKLISDEVTTELSWEVCEFVMEKCVHLIL